MPPKGASDAQAGASTLTMLCKAAEATCTVAGREPVSGSEPARARPALMLFGGWRSGARQDSHPQGACQRETRVAETPGLSGRQACVTEGHKLDEWACPHRETLGPWSGERSPPGPVSRGSDSLILRRTKLHPPLERPWLLSPPPWWGLPEGCGSCPQTKVAWICSSCGSSLRAPGAFWELGLNEQRASGSAGVQGGCRRPACPPPS